MIVSERNLRSTFRSKINQGKCTITMPFIWKHQLHFHAWYICMTKLSLVSIYLEVSMSSIDATIHMVYVCGIPLCTLHFYCLWWLTVSLGVNYPKRWLSTTGIYTAANALRDWGSNIWSASRREGLWFHIMQYGNAEVDCGTLRVFTSIYLDSYL